MMVASGLFSAIQGKRPVVRLHSGGQGGGRGRLVWRGKVARIICQQRELRQRIDGQLPVGATHINASRGQPLGREAFADEQDNSKRFLNDPMLKVKDPRPAKASRQNKASNWLRHFTRAM